ncbi:heme-binding domain-containing protein [Oscillochloris sp. ZM17-4]|uniref:heme-binding domain-containing protein n=1 Tax=Oscillochloris sp. ZM17-4 TaxID=2866714 RepID=UPI002101D554|nr:heme-binding domain-containing protein [Oscillochloris sp. ZM17-4]
MSTRPSLLRTLLRPRNIAIAIIGLFVLIQLVPVWAFQDNPPVLDEPAWDSPQTRALAVRACFDCHSNETTWPWYSKVAPVSWLVTRHVTEGREKMNFSEWSKVRERDEAAGHSAKLIRDGEMPTKDFLLIHPEARLTAAEQQQLIDGLNASLR